MRFCRFSAEGLSLLCIRRLMKYWCSYSTCCRNLAANYQDKESLRERNKPRLQKRVGGPSSIVPGLLVQLPSLCLLTKSYCMLSAVCKSSMEVVSVFLSFFEDFKSLLTSRPVLYMFQELCVLINMDEEMLAFAYFFHGKISWRHSD